MIVSCTYVILSCTYKISIMYVHDNTMYKMSVSIYSIHSFASPRLLHSMVHLASPIVRFYFALGLRYLEILEMLARIHGIVISLRTLKRILSEAQLHRRKKQSDILDVALFVMEEIENAGQLHGYKLMHLKCIQNGFTVTQSTVSLLQHIINPAGVLYRKRNRLRKGIYSTPGSSKAIRHM